MKSLFLVATLLCCTPTLAGEFKETKKGIRDILTNERWAATIPLYKTRVYEGGHVTNKPDRESIMPGQHVVIDTPILVYKKGEVRVDVRHPQGVSRFSMRFYFNDRIGQESERDIIAFRKMVGLVLEPMPK